MRDLTARAGSCCLPLTVFMAAAIGVLGIRAVFPAEAASKDGSDYESFYEPVARNLLEGRGFVLGDGRAALRYPPGYPVVLAGTFAAARVLPISEQQAIGVLAAISVGVAALCVFELARRVWPGRRALLAPALVATYPLLLWLGRQPSSELPFLGLLSAAVLTFWMIFSSRRPAGFALLTGGLAGLAMLVRPIALGLGVLLAAFAWSWADGRRRVRAGLAGMILLGNLLIVIPWEAWAFAQSGRIVPLSTGGVASVRDGLTFAGGRKQWRERQDVPKDVAELTADIEAHYGELKSLRDIGGLLVGEAAARPVALAKLLSWKVIRPWYATDSRRHELSLALVQGPYLILLVWSGVRARAQGRAEARLVSLLATFCLLFWMMAFLTLSIVRYLVPAIALLFALVPAVFPRRASPEPDHCRIR